MRRIFRAFRRYFTILGVFIDYGFRIFANRFVKSVPALIPPQELREVLEKLGGSFLKFGQLAAVRPDYFPEEYCQELLRLLDEVPPFKPEFLDKIFLEEYGKRPEEIFAKFERVPFAAASFGQVHEAFLKEGEKVAVKVQRPFVAEDFAFDARFFSFLGWLLRRTGIIKTVNPAKIVREFIHWTERELDYVQEAEHLERLYGQVAKNKLPVKIPKAFRDYTTRRVLVMEFIEGRTLKSHYLAGEAPPNAHQFFKDVIFFELYSYLFDGFFHADPHPANILVRPGGGLPAGQAGVGFIDAGIAAEIRVSDRKKMSRYVRAVAKEELEPAVKAFLGMVRTPLLEILAEARMNYPQHWMRIQFIKNAFMRRLKEGLGDLLRRWHKASREGGNLHDRSPMHKFMELMMLAERNGIRMPETSVLFARTFLSIDVTILTLAPKLNITQVVDEFFLKYQEEFLRLEELPDEEPLYSALGFNGELREIYQALEAEIKAVEKELLTERVSGMMERFE